MHDLLLYKKKVKFCYNIDETGSGYCGFAVILWNSSGANAIYIEFRTIYDIIITLELNRQTEGAVYHAVGYYDRNVQESI